MCPTESGVALTGRPADVVLDAHCLSETDCRGKLIYDLGCGLSNLENDLALSGIEARVIGVDCSDIVVSQRFHRRPSYQVVRAELTNIPLPDESADIVLATYSLPFWAQSARQIRDFFEECKRLVRLEGVLGVYPTTVPKRTARRFHFEPYEGRNQAAQQGCLDILHSPCWVPMGHFRRGLTAKKIKSLLSANTLGHNPNLFNRDPNNARRMF